jgi:hypothetical protein
MTSALEETKSFIKCVCKIVENLLGLSCLSVCPSVHMEHLRSHQKVFRVIWYWSIKKIIDNFFFITVGPEYQVLYMQTNRPASWLCGQNFWLLAMRSRVRFPVLPWEFSLAREDPHSDHGLGSLYNLCLRPLLLHHADSYHHSHHRGNVSAPYGRPNLRSRLYSATTGRKTRSLYGHVLALGGKCTDV